MTPELVEFRKWNIVAELIEDFSGGCIVPVVTNTGGIEGITMLATRGDKAFFFFSCHPDEGGITANTWKADSDEMISTSMLFPTGMPDCVTFREIAQMAIAKILQ